jgi:glycerophosphoryl diester phosphodiesterase
MQAWTSGVSFCECDVILTTDGHIILSHDDDLSRLALAKDGHAARNIAQLTFSEVISTPLKVRKKLFRFPRFHLHFFFLGGS